MSRNSSWMQRTVANVGVLMQDYGVEYCILSYHYLIEIAFELNYIKAHRKLKALSVYKVDDNRTSYYLVRY